MKLFGGAGPLDDEVLVRNVLDGDQRSFRLLVERHRPRLLRVAGALLHDADLAGDAVQEGFIKAYAALAEYRGSGRFGGWLRKIVVNECLAMIRQRRPSVALDEAALELPSQDPGPEAAFLAGTEVAGLRKALAELPAPWSAALSLRCVEGLSYREISGLLGVPESTIETWIHRGRTRLRTLYQPGSASPSAATVETRPRLQRSLGREVC